MGNEKAFTINQETTNSLIQLFRTLDLVIPTQSIQQNIDHIIIPKSFESLLLKSEIFIKKNELSDHPGILIELKQK